MPGYELLFNYAEGQYAAVQTLRYQIRRQPQKGAGAVQVVAEENVLTRNVPNLPHGGSGQAEQKIREKKMICNALIHIHPL